MQRSGVLQGLDSRFVGVPSRLRAAALLAVCAGLLSAASFGYAAGDAAKAQVPAVAKPAAAAKTTVHRHRRTVAKPSPAVVAATPAPVAPVAPPAPDWPANDQPKAAEVVWDSHGLKIDASNSSLEQILKDVSTATGAKLEGLTADQRVFGTYGPGTAREVLSELLDGSGYNVLMIGDQGEETPREIVLSTKPSGPAPASGRGQPANTVAEEEPEIAPEPPQSPFRNGMPPNRTPEEMREEREGRTPQLQQLQQFQQNGLPTTAPNPQN